MNRNVSFLAGFGLGVALMFVADPSGGRRRRALLRDQLRHLYRKTGDGLDAKVRHWSNRVSGGVNEIYQAAQPEEVFGKRVVERVRAALGRVVSHPHAIDVTASDDGRVCLSGPILASEVAPLLRVAAAVRGVTAVDNRLDVHEQPGNVPALQGGATASDSNRRNAWPS